MYPDINAIVNNRDFMEKLARNIINQMVYIKHFWATMPEADKRLYYGYLPEEIFAEVLGLEQKKNKEL